ncbi:hypothetical protein [Planotetraspora silvatica]|uniref:hypothetical protein n=1 Tax=Planotetraspora silvatica TaxID=234614 RepID=UPI0019520B7E|nr:hypothetical protein [Planotetraspora silvatica]
MHRFVIMGLGLVLFGRDHVRFRECAAWPALPTLVIMYGWAIGLPAPIWIRAVHEYGGAAVALRRARSPR